MKALSQVLADQNKELVGIDHQPGRIRLTGRIELNVQGFESLSSLPADLLITSEAHLFHPEVQAWGSRGKVLGYAWALSQLFSGRFGVSVSGSHGKTTSSAILGYLATEIGLDPTVIVGGELETYKRNGWGGDSNIFIAEADEYLDKFSLYSPKIGLITNIEYDHPDFFRTPEEYTAAFNRFIAAIGKREGLVVANCDDGVLASLAQRYRDFFVTFGSSAGADWRLVGHGRRGNVSFFEVEHKSQIFEFELGLPGRHNIYNALGAIATMATVYRQMRLPFDFMKVIKILRRFVGTAKRLQLLGQWRDFLVYEDYAHHPSQLKVVLETLRQLYSGRRIVIVFEPHTVSRTVAFASEWTLELSKADRVYVLPVYRAWRDLGQSYDSRHLTAGRKNMEAVIDHEDAMDKLRAESDGVLVLVGAGEVGKIWTLLKE